MGIRRFQVLVGGLPLDGALARSLDPERTGVGWTQDHDFYALLAELIDHSNRLTLAGMVKKGTKIPDPIFIPRPHVKRERSSAPKDVAGVIHKLGMRVIKVDTDPPTSED